MMQERDRIFSIKDKRIVEARELSTAAGRMRGGKFLLEGDQAGRDSATFGKELEALLRRLLDEEYVRRMHENGDDKFEITDKGEKLLAGLWPVIEIAEERVLSGFDAKEREQLFSYLKRIQENCIAMIDEK